MKPQAPKSDGNQVNASEWNSSVQENIKIVESTSQTLSEGDGFQLSKGVAQYSSVGDYYVDTGTVNNYVVNAISPMQGIPNLKTGQIIRFVPTNTNTGAAFVNVQGTGNISLRNNEGGVLAGGEVQATVETKIEYDGTYWRLVNGSTGLTALLYPVDGLTVSNNVTNPNTHLDFAAGKCADSNKNFLMVNTTGGFNKNMTTNWAAGSGNGGKASAISIIADSWAYVFAVSRVTGEIDFGIDTSLTATNLLADTATYGYTKWRRIWTVYFLPTTAYIRLFTQYKNTCVWKGPLSLTTTEFAQVNVNNTATYNFTMAVPPSIELDVVINYLASAGAGGTGFELYAFNSNQTRYLAAQRTSPTGASPIGFDQGTPVADERGQLHFTPALDRLLKFTVRTTASQGQVYMNTIKYIDFRSD